MILDTAGLKPSKDARRYRLAGNKVSVTDGPFAETKELVGGFVMLAVDSEEEARSFAEQFIALHRDNWPGLELECELRAVEGV